MNATCFLTFLPFVLACGRDAAPVTDSTATPGTTPITAARVDSGAPSFSPRDNASESFREFRERALQALSRRDTAFLYGIISRDIRVSFGSGGGLQDFKEMWKPEDAKSAVWAILTRLLRMGGQQNSDSMFTAPYVFAAWPDSLDAFSHVAVVSDGAAIHTMPDVQSDILGTAGYSILRVIEWRGVPALPATADSNWAHVRLPDNRTGWMRGDDVYSPVGWRATFARRLDRWVMILLVAGD